MSKIYTVNELGDLEECLIVKKACGNCRHWMNQECPREFDKHKKKPNQLNSCNGIPCNMWERDLLYKNDIIQ